jgi:hypothetical protein
MGAALGASSRSKPSRLAASSSFMVLIPVALPPGRLRLTTRPAATGSPGQVNTIGMVAVAALAASVAGWLETATTTATRRRTRSAVNSGNRSFCPPAQRYSIVTFRPSTKPAWLRPVRNPARRLAFCSSVPECRNPITGVASCCARAATGHTAAPARARTKSRRLTRSPRRRARAAGPEFPARSPSRP